MGTTPAPPNVPKFPAFEDMQNLKKLKNREAARKCRQKKIEKIKILEKENLELKEKYENSRKKNKTYENIIKSIAEGYKKRKASNEKNWDIDDLHDTINNQININLLRD